MVANQRVYATVGALHCPFSSETTMNYQEQLNPWVIHKLLPNLQQVSVARFRHRNDADAYLKLMNRMFPHVQFCVAFDVNRPDSSPKADAEGKTPTSPKAKSKTKATSTPLV